MIRSTEDHVYKFSTEAIAGLAQIGCRVTRATSTQPTPANTSVFISFNNEVYDLNNEFDSTVTSGTADATEANKLHDADGGFTSDMVGAKVLNKTDSTYTTVSAFVDSGELTLNDDIFVSGETYDIYESKYTATEDGTYIAFAVIRFETPPDGTNCITFLRKNGTNVGINQLPIGAAKNIAIIAGLIIDLDADDYVEVLGRIDAGSGVIAQTGDTWFAIHKIG